MDKRANPILEEERELLTSRLNLRAWRPEDLEDFYQYARDPEVGPRAGWQVHRSREVTKKVLEYFVDLGKVLAIEERKSAKVIGSLGIDELISPLKELFSAYNGRELGFVLNRDYWRRGFMSEAVEAIKEELFKVYKIDFLLCGHFEENEASKGLIVKTGFRNIGQMNYVDQAKKVHRTLIYYLWNPDKKDPFTVVEDIFEGRSHGQLYSYY